jgi:hypothetical protein
MAVRCHVCAPNTTDGHLLLATRLIAATDGHSSEEIEVWSERGELLAVSQLLRREEAAPFRADVR